MKCFSSKKHLYLKKELGIRYKNSSCCTYSKWVEDWFL